MQIDPHFLSFAAGILFMLGVSEYKRTFARKPPDGKVICPVCNGNKKSIAFANTGENIDEHYCVERDCHYCHGRGEFSAFDIYELGETDLAKKRIAQKENSKKLDEIVNCARQTV